MSKKQDDFDNDEFVGDSNDTFDAPGDESFTPDFSDTHDEVVLEKGTEAQLRVVSVDSGQGPKGPYKRIGYEIVDEPFAKNVYNVISMPNENDDAKRRNRKNLRLRDFMTAHGLPLDRPFNWSDLIGVELYAILGVEESEQYGDKNVIQKYL